MRLTTLFLTVATSFAAATTCQSQDSNFSSVLQVNNQVITGYELEQRIHFLELLRFPGDIPAEAQKGLIEDRLRTAAAKTAGIIVTDDMVQSGMAEFAARANLDTDKFLAAIAQGGIAPETFRDFVKSGVAWRTLIRTKYASRLVISESEIDRELSADAGRGAGPRVLISEIIIPAPTGGMAQARALVEGLTETITSEAAFADAARQYSIAASRDQGGKVDWIPLTNLPPQVRGALATLGEGQLTGPVPLAGGVGLFQLRGLEGAGETLGKPTVNPGQIAIDYAQYRLPAGVDAAAEAARIRGVADTCDDLFQLANGQPATQLTRHKDLRGTVPSDILSQLDRLDANEIAVRQPAGSAPSLLMLCERNATLASGNLAPFVAPEIGTTYTGIPSVVEGAGFGNGPTRDQIREEITSRRLAQLADGYLAELKANAIIRTP